MSRYSRRKKLLLLLTLLPVLALMGMIFGFSAQPGEESMKTSGEVVDKVLEVTEPDLAQKPVEEQKVIISNTQFYVRKTAHFSEFLALGFFLTLHLLIWRPRFYPLYAAAIGIVYAATDELHQILTGSRTPQVRDVCIDAAGVVMGVLLFLLILFILRRLLLKAKTKA